MTFNVIMSIVLIISVVVRNSTVAVMPPAEESGRNSQSPSVSVMFGPMANLLFVLLPRELLAFDTELGQPLSQTGIGAPLAAAVQLLHIFGFGGGSSSSPGGTVPGDGGSSNFAGGGSGGGSDVVAGDIGVGALHALEWVAILHADNSISTWRRVAGTIR